MPSFCLQKLPVIFAALLLPLFSSLCYSGAKAAESTGGYVYAMKSQHEVVFENYTPVGVLQPGNLVRLQGLNCSLNNYKQFHKEGFIHRGRVIWAGSLYPGASFILVRLVPCWADMEGDPRPLQKVFILEQKEGVVFHAFSLHAEQGDAFEVREKDGKRFIINTIQHKDKVTCWYWHSTGGLSGVHIDYSPEEFSMLGGTCPTDGFAEVESGRVTIAKIVRSCDF